MLSLCHRLPDGSETIIAAHSVTKDSNKTVTYRYAPFSEETELREGTVFVMNQNGKTVTRYTIS